MNGKLVELLVVLLLTMGLATGASAALIDRGNGMIYDDDLGIIWLADANYAATQWADTGGLVRVVDGRMDWIEAVNWAEALVYGGYDDWRLPKADGVCSGRCTGVENELGHLFYDELGGPYWGSTFSNVQLQYYWSGTLGFGLSAWGFNMFLGEQNEQPADFRYYAWAVRDGDVSPAVPPPGSTALPLPGTGILLLAGGIGILLIRGATSAAQGRRA